jgi:hypothetical protein
MNAGSQSSHQAFPNEVHQRGSTNWGLPMGVPHLGPPSSPHGCPPSGVTKVVHKFCSTKPCPLMITQLGYRDLGPPRGLPPIWGARRGSAKRVPQVGLPSCVPHSCPTRVFHQRGHPGGVPKGSAQLGLPSWVPKVVPLCTFNRGVLHKCPHPLSRKGGPSNGSPWGFRKRFYQGAPRYVSPNWCPQISVPQGVRSRVFPKRLSPKCGPHEFSRKAFSPRVVPHVWSLKMGPRRWPPWCIPQVGFIEGRFHQAVCKWGPTRFVPRLRSP